MFGNVADCAAIKDIRAQNRNICNGPTCQKNCEKIFWCNVHIEGYPVAPLVDALVLHKCYTPGSCKSITLWQIHRSVAGMTQGCLKIVRAMTPSKHQLI